MEHPYQDEQRQRCCRKVKTAGDDHNDKGHKENLALTKSVNEVAREDTGKCGAHNERAGSKSACGIRRSKLLDRIQGHGRDEDVEDQVLTEVDNPGQDEGRCHEPGLILTLGCRGVTCNASLTVLAVNVA